MTEEPAEPGWNISANKLVVEDCAAWDPRFHSMQRSRRRKSRPEEARINCCGTFNYQSNNNVDSSCLETYRYDHSIYFKTIGDIRSGGDRNRKCSLTRAESPDELAPEFDHEQVEWSAKTIGEIECHRCDGDELETDVYEFLNNENKECVDFGNIDSGQKAEYRTESLPKISQVWPIVDLTQLDIKTDQSTCSGDGERFEGHTIVQMNDSDDDNQSLNKDDYNGNCKSYDYYNESENCVNGNRNSQRQKENVDSIKTDGSHFITQTSSGREEGERKELVSIRRTRQSPRKVSQPTVVGENNVVWPGVLLNYKNNVDPVYAPHRHSIKK